tara:strand:- start:384 stop:710 length:327 start_codon:yes stop_codon:yes gene_type:complete
MPKKTKINIEENEVREISSEPQTPRKISDDKVKQAVNEVKNKQPPENTESKMMTVEVPVDFLRNVRNVVYATSERVQWKTEELFPVGLVVKQLDNLLSNIDQDIKKQE